MLRGLPIIAVACLAGLVLVGCSQRIAPPPSHTTVIPEAEREYVVESSKKAGKGKKAKKKEKKEKKEKKRQAKKGDSESMNPQAQELSPEVILEHVNAACRKESRAKGISSIAAIFGRSSREKAYAECMRKKGFNVGE